MKYISGIHALNLPCQLETCGDWHTSALQWDHPVMEESEHNVFRDYGIEYDKRIPEHEETYAVANHIRALLDLLASGHFALAQGMRKDFICNEAYTEEIFNKVYDLHEDTRWSEIERFMHKEYGRRWRTWRNGKRAWNRNQS